MQQPRVSRTRRRAMKTKTKKDYGFIPQPEQVEELKVTRIGKRWHCRLLINGKMFFLEAAVDRQDCIGYACVQLLRTADKLGLSSRRTSAARLNYLDRRPYPKMTGKVQFINTL